MTDMPRCRTCKHFAPYDGYPGDVGPEWGICSRITDESDPDDPANLASVIYPYERGSQLAVAPEFGCVQHAPREDAQ